MNEVIAGLGTPSRPSLPAARSAEDAGNTGARSLIALRSATGVALIAATVLASMSGFLDG